MSTNNDGQERPEIDFVKLIILVLLAALLATGVAWGAGSDLRTTIEWGCGVGAFVMVLGLLSA